MGGIGSNKSKLQVIVNPLNQLADMRLVAHMRHVAFQFMKESHKRKRPWAKHRLTMFAFDRPPLNVLKEPPHLNMHIINLADKMNTMKTIIHNALMTSSTEVVGNMVTRLPANRLSFDEI